MQVNGWHKDSGGRGLIAIDESTTIKNHKAKRTKALLKIAAGFQFRAIAYWFSNYKESHGRIFTVRVPPSWVTRVR